ncbi:vWA domain-containing protein [Flavobacterium lindanitolerans]|uniref:Membrane protein (TIGR02226 family) n=2 Tax=Flavobacterium lindanitolerans TaxID=428988 RepID=A0A497TYZ4_9FLAO|nr:BatA and WFA domain-containing protein [Flavobacterium lindanitolerans]PKW30081.1 putative membrane protein (TIGR02226 family) [Flavobacterium lindanitolerans]RLJ24421.1 putative membrane protein (TIGR02226 family) [Flavobacterium lindanitolerans]
MQFKHPEILYFLFLLVIPILVHLFQLRRFKKEYFTNVHFLKELAIQTRKSSRLKKWLLLLTRLFLLACLIIAFAQPFFQAKDSKGITNEMFIVLDNSFSMQAKGKQGELMKRAVQELLENVPENQTFSLITNSETFWNTDIKSIQRELQNLKYSASPFVLDNLMAKIKSRKSPYNKDIVIITDAVGLQPKQLKNIDSTSNAYFIIPKAEQKNNVAIDSVFIQQALDNFYEIGITLSFYGDNEKDIPISLYNNKKLVAKTIVNFEGKEKSINFTIPKGDFNGYAAIDDNALQYDNQLFFSISKPQKMNIVSIGQPEKSSFLKKIYSDNEFIFSNFDLKTLDYNILEKQDAIILNEVPEVPQALQTTLKTFVEKGGNLIVIPSSESSISNLNSLMGNFGKIQFKSLENGEKLVTKIAFNHPLYSTVFEKKIDNFQYPNVSSAYSISSAYPSILSFEDQNAFLTAIQNPVSSVYVFSAPLNKNNSNFQNSPLIVPTFYNMALSSQKTGISALTIGENSPFLIDASLSKDEIVEIKSLSEETNEKFIPMQQILNNKVKLTFNDFPQEAGNYGIYKQDNLLKEISFNYARTESNIATSNESVLSDYNVIGSIDEVFDTLQTNRTDNEIWKWFVFLTLLFLVTEILIQKFVK